MPAAQRNAHSALIVELRGGAPVDFIGADYAVAAASQFVANASVLIGVVADRQYHASLQQKTGTPGAAAGRAVFAT